MSSKPETKPVYECETCGQTYKIQSRFLAHKCKGIKTARTNTSEVHFECQYCHINYATENGLLKHQCKTKERIDQAQSPLGQAAYLFYAKWMKSTGKSIPPVSTFIASRYYESFIRFARFNKAIKLPSVDVYVQVMKAKEIGPELWSDDRAYGIYLEYMEYHANPNESVKITSQTLERLANEYECDIGDVFTKGNKNEIIQMIRERRLSPWILLRSTRFKQFLGSCSDAQLDMVENLIDARYWKRRFTENPKVAKLMSLYVQELGV